MMKSSVSMMNYHTTTTSTRRHFNAFASRLHAIVINNERITYQNYTQRYMSTQSVRPPPNTNSNTKNGSTNVVGTESSTSTTTGSNVLRKKNQMLKTVIREGLISLNQSVQVIQKNADTYKSIKKQADDEDILETADDINRTTEGHRILDVAQESLDTVCRNKAPGNTNSLLTINGDPIVLLGVDVRPSNRHADLFWTIPASVLFSDQYTLHQKVEIQKLMETRFQQQITLGIQRQQMNKPPTIVSQWFRRIYSILSTYYPPKIRLKAATPVMMQQVIEDEKEI